MDDSFHDSVGLGLDQGMVVFGWFFGVCIFTGWALRAYSATQHGTGFIGFVTRKQQHGGVRKIFFRKNEKNFVAAGGWRVSHAQVVECQLLTK